MILSACYRVPFRFTACLTSTERVSLSDSPAGFVTVNLNTIVKSDYKFEGAINLVLASLGLPSCT